MIFLCSFFHHEPGSGVRSPGELDEVNVHFFWRRIYYQEEEWGHCDRVCVKAGDTRCSQICKSPPPPVTTASGNVQPNPAARRKVHPKPSYYHKHDKRVPFWQEKLQPPSTYLKKIQLPPQFPNVLPSW